MAAPIWTTPSDLGNALSLSAYTVTLQALPVSPAASVTYTVISGALPTGFSLAGDVISGNMPTVGLNTSYSWTIRARDNLGNIRDRTFTIIATPQPPAYFTDTFTIINSQDSLWIEHSVSYYNPEPSQSVVITLESGTLPTGLTLDSSGLIKGYAQKPLLGLTVSSFAHTVTSISTTVLQTASTGPLQVGAQIVYGTSGGNIVAGQYYYIKEILNSTDYTISEWQYGTTFNVGSITGITGTQQAGTTTTPVKRSSLFSLKLSSTIGFDLGNFEIQIINQNLPIAEGGPGLSTNTRTPAIVNSREITPTPDVDWYPYLLPPPRSPATQISVGSYPANQDLAFHILGYDFDTETTSVTFIFTGLPTGLTGDSATGWITGQIVSLVPSITTYSFTVEAQKNGFPAIISPLYNFSIEVTNGVTNDITWSGTSDLGILTNCQISELSVATASSSQSLLYKLATGSSLPANLSLTSDGLIAGRVADQPTNDFLNLGDITTFNFTVEAYNPDFPTISSSKTFTLKILQAFSIPNENLYYRALCDFPTRSKVSNALNDPNLIPPSSLYRANDPYFGLSTYIWFTQAYGIVSSSVDEYVTALTENHYLRSVTLGQIETARATDSQGNVIYEVVYSKIIDNLINSKGVSIPQTITWPRMINYGVNLWVTSMTTVFTSYIQLYTQLYYVSLAPLSTQTLHPASLPDMRQRVIDICGSVPTQLLLPKWMTSQQENGAALGYVPAWVICYTLPGKSAEIANNLRTKWDYTLNEVNFSLDRVFVDRSSTYNLQSKLAAETWLTLPSANPVPIPSNQYDNIILFPQETILPQ